MREGIGRGSAPGRKEPRVIRSPSSRLRLRAGLCLVEAIGDRSAGTKQASDEWSIVGCGGMQQLWGQTGDQGLPFGLAGRKGHRQVCKLADVA